MYVSNVQFAPVRAYPSAAVKAMFLILNAFLFCVSYVPANAFGNGESVKLYP